MASAAEKEAIEALIVELEEQHEYMWDEILNLPGYSASLPDGKGLITLDVNIEDGENCWIVFHELGKRDQLWRLNGWCSRIEGATWYEGVEPVSPQMKIVTLYVTDETGDARAS